MRQSAALLATVAVAVGLCLLARALWHRSTTFLADTWQGELEGAPDERVGVILGHLAELGESAYPALAHALASDRQAVAEGALRVLRSEVACWSKLSMPDALRRKRSLGIALAQSFPWYSAQIRRAAQSIIAAILESAPIPSGARDVEFLAACTEMLRADGSSGGGLPSTPMAGGTPPGATGSDNHSDPGLLPATASRVGSETAITTPDSKNGMSNPPGFASVSDNAIKATEPGPLSVSRGVKRLLPVGDVGTVNPLRTSSQTQPATSEAGQPDTQFAASNEPQRLSTVRRTGFDNRAPLDGLTAEGPQGADDLRRVAQRLRDADPREADAARRALRDRGFSEVEVELARQLTDPNPGERRKLARAVLSQAGVDAAPWLLELAHDTDADVRLEAMTLLATTDDPALLDQLRRLVRADPDQRIQGLADRLSRDSLLFETPGKAGKTRP